MFGDKVLPVKRLAPLCGTVQPGLPSEDVEFVVHIYRKLRNSISNQPEGPVATRQTAENRAGSSPCV